MSRAELEHVLARGLEGKKIRLKNNKLRLSAALHRTIHNSISQNGLAGYLRRGTHRSRTTQNFEFWACHRLPVNYQVVNRLISVLYSFRHVGTIRLTLAPNPLETLSHLHGISTPLAPEDSV